MSSKERALFAGALVLALLVRAEYLRELLLSPFGHHLQLDAEWYHQAARQILGGIPLAEGQAYFRPPLYPLFLAGIHRVFGEELLGPRIVQMLLGIAHVWMCWRIARRTHGDLAAVVTAFAAASYGMFVYFEAELLTTSVGFVLTTAAVLLLLEGDRRRSLGLLGAGGLAIGLASITHATALVLAPVAVLWAFFSRRSSRNARLACAALVALGVSIPVGAVTARNWVASNELVLIGSQGGINFYIGNNADSDGKSALAPGFAEAAQVMRTDGRYRDTMEVAARTLAERALGRSLGTGEINRYWFGEGLDWMREHPRDAAKLLFDKVVFFWSSFEISNNRDLRDQAARFTPILRVFLLQFTFLLPLALYGIVRRRFWTRERLLLLSSLAVYSLAIVSFFVCARYRQTAVAWLLPFAAAGALAFVDDVRRAREAPLRTGALTALLAMFFLFTNAGWLTRLGIANVTAETDAPFHRYNLAVLFEQDGDLDRAILEYRAAAGTGLVDPRIHLNLGNALARTGRASEAREEYRKVLRIAPGYETAVRSNLAILATQEGNFSEAIRQFEICLDRDPSHEKALLGLASSHLAAGQFDQATVALQRALDAGVGNEAELRSRLGVAYLEIGLLEEAEAECLAALRLSENEVVAVVTLGKIYMSQGNEDAAEQMFARARGVAPGPAVEQAIEEARARAE